MALSAETKALVNSALRGKRRQKPALRFDLVIVGVENITSTRKWYWLISQDAPKRPWADWQLSGPFDRDLNANDGIVKNYLRIASRSSHRYSSQLTYRYSWPDSFPPAPVFLFFSYSSPSFSFPLVIFRFLFNYRYHPTFPFGPQVFFSWLDIFSFSSPQSVAVPFELGSHIGSLSRERRRKKAWNKTSRKVE